MRLNPPTLLVFLVALLAAILAVAALFISIPMVSAYAFWIMTGAFTLLALSCILKGL